MSINVATQASYIDLANREGTFDSDDTLEQIYAVSPLDEPLLTVASRVTNALIGWVYGINA